VHTWLWLLLTRRICGPSIPHSSYISGLIITTLAQVRVRWYLTGHYYNNIERPWAASQRYKGGVSDKYYFRWLSRWVDAFSPNGLEHLTRISHYDTIRILGRAMFFPSVPLFGLSLVKDRDWLNMYSQTRTQEFNRQDYNDLVLDILLPFGLARYGASYCP
jgi:hypothetical protein